MMGILEIVRKELGADVLTAEEAEDETPDTNDGTVGIDDELD